MNTSFVRGPLQMLFSALCFAVMALFAKLSAARVPGSEVAFVRFGFGIVVSLILATLGKVDLRTANRRLLILRGIFGAGGILLYFLALAGGSLTNATILNNAYPLFGAVVAAVVLGEPIGFVTGVCLVTAAVGMGLLVHPDFRHLFWPDWVALLSALLSGFAVVIIRELRRSGESTWTVFFYLSIFGFVASAFLAIPAWVWPDPRTAAYILLMAALGMIAQVTMTAAYKYCSTAVGGVLSMAMMLFAALLGLVTLGERLSLGEALGAALIALSSVAVVLQQVPVAYRPGGKSQRRTPAPLSE